MIWFYLFMAACGLLYILSAVYEWRWIRKLERRIYFLERIDWHTARLLYLMVGIGGLGIAVAGICGLILASSSPILIVVGLALAYLFANTLLNHRKNQSILELFRNDRL